MTAIDYTKYSIESLLDAKANINKEAYPENYAALLRKFKERNFDLGAYYEEQKNRKFISAEKRVKIVGIFQILAAFVIPLYMLLLISNERSFTAIVYIVAVIFIAFNAIAGYTAIKGIKSYYWLSILNQSLQLFSGAVGSVLINYSGIGGVYALVRWGESSDFNLSATFNPGFNILIFEQPLPSGYFAVDIMAIIFITALVTARDNDSQLTTRSIGTLNP